MISRNTLSIPIKIVTEKNEETVETLALVDSGAGGKFINQNFAKNFKINKLDKPLKAYNVDGIENKRGTIRHYVDLKFIIGKRNFDEQLLVTGLGKQKIILGFPWLSEENPIIDWKTGQINWRNTPVKPKIETKLNEDEHKNQTLNPLKENTSHILSELINGLELDEIRINAKTNIAMDLAIEENKKKEDILVKELVPEEYHEYLNVFDENKANRFPDS